MKSAFVSIVGRPSTGKSSLLNSLCGAKVSIVSPVPQTTRNNIRGIVTNDDCQLVFCDTPGIHLSDKKLNKKLSTTALASLADTDIVLYLLDAARPVGGEEEEAIAEKLAALGEERLCATTLAVINKIDAAKAKPELCISFVNTALPAIPPAHILSVSALKCTNLDTLLAALRGLAPEGPFYYDAEYYTDQEVSFRIAEIVREKCFLLLREELPHALYVDVCDADLKGSVLTASVFIRCERESQKGMIVGKGGEMIKKIRMAAAAELKKIFDWTIKLDIRVKTDKNWRHNDSIIKKFV